MYIPLHCYKLINGVIEYKLYAENTVQSLYIYHCHEFINGVIEYKLYAKNAVQSMNAEWGTLLSFHEVQDLSQGSLGL